MAWDRGGCYPVCNARVVRGIWWIYRRIILPSSMPRQTSSVPITWLGSARTQSCVSRVESYSVRWWAFIHQIEVQEWRWHCSVSQSGIYFHLHLLLLALRTWRCLWRVYDGFWFLFIVDLLHGKHRWRWPGRLQRPRPQVLERGVRRGVSPPEEMLSHLTLRKAQR